MLIVCRDLRLLELGGDSLDDAKRELISLDGPKGFFPWIY